MEKEYRYIGFDAAEIREHDGAEYAEGYVNEFEKLSEDLGGFREQTDPKVFDRSLRENDVVALWQHDQKDPIGRVSNGLLELQSDERGLRFRIPAKAFTERQLEKLRDGTVKNMSFGFRTIEDKWEKRDGENIRTLVDVDLFEVSPVTFPAYADSSAAVRSLEEWRASEVEPEPEAKGPDALTVAYKQKAKKREENIAKPQAA